jgi:membrane peptidoglycan carboxypeptidase
VTFQKRQVGTLFDTPPPSPSPRRRSTVLHDVIAKIRTFPWRRRWKSIVAGIVGFGILYLAFLWITLPDISDQRTLIAAESTVITDRNGIELYRLFEGQDRTYIPLSVIPKHLQDAIVAIEDARFYDRGCVDIRALARAVLANLYGGFKSQGGSTITQQLARNALLSDRSKTFQRKFKELLLACSLERQYDKDTLLELYLNWIPFGQNAYGIEQASRMYFGKSASGLTLAQSAVLAALPQRPSYLSPYGKHVRTDLTIEAKERIANGTLTSSDDVKDEDVVLGLLGRKVGSGSSAFYVGGRTDQVLRNMEDMDLITEAERLTALTEMETMTFQQVREDIRAPHFVLWIKKQVEDLLGDQAEEGFLDRGGWHIETTLDWELQQAADMAVKTYHEDIAKLYGANNIALVALNPHSREILAYVGNADYADEENDGKIDMVRIPRQPGSSFKPLVYASAFEQGYGPGTVLPDVPTKFGDDTPQNFDGKFWGLMTVRKALAASRNIPAIKAFFLAGGEEPVLTMASRLGAITPAQTRADRRTLGEDVSYGWPLAIGAAETPLLEMAQAYSTFADGGLQKPVVSILRITDKHGAIRYEPPESEGQRVLDERIAYQITNILSDAPARPNTYWQSVLSVPGFAAAAKTGTSNKCLERKGGGDTGSCTSRRPDNLWTIGYTPSLLAGVWVGNATNEALSEKAESLTTASPIWKDFMVRAHKILENPVTAFTQPSGMVQPLISTLSGELPSECTPVEWRTPELFLSDKAPTQTDPACATLAIDRVTGLLASPTCPAEAQETRSFLVLKSAAAERWPLWEKGLQEWATEQMKSWDPQHGWASGALLPLPLAPSAACDPALTPGRMEKPSVTIKVPSDGGTVAYPSFRPKLKLKTGSIAREVTFTIDNKPAGQFGSGSLENMTIRVPRAIEEGGSHTLEVIVTDHYFNTATDKVDFRFGEDRSPPSVRLNVTKTTLGKSDTLIVEADARDDEGDVKYVQYFLDDTLLSTKPTSPYRLEFPLEDTTSGTHTLRAVAIDLAGNEGEDEEEVTVR